MSVCFFYQVFFSLCAVEFLSFLSTDYNQLMFLALPVTNKIAKRVSN